MTRYDFGMVISVLLACLAFTLAALNFTDDKLHPREARHRAKWYAAVGLFWLLMFVLIAAIFS